MRLSDLGERQQDFRECMEGLEKQLRKDPVVEES